MCIDNEIEKLIKKMSQEPAYTLESNGVRVTVFPVFLESQSVPEDNHYLWAYHVRIENLTNSSLQLRTRYWRITDALGRIQEIRGGGVVGEQPIIKPGETYEYTSGTPLSTPSGIMVGHYQMETVDGQLLNVDIPAFSLDSPHQTISLN
jgi:ApaG protein